MTSQLAGKEARVGPPGTGPAPTGREHGGNSWKAFLFYRHAKNLFRECVSNTDRNMDFSRQMQDIAPVNST
jgi:hypothetical protein